MAFFLNKYEAMLTVYKETDIHFTSEGTGNPIILLHGFLESLEVWDEVASSLSRERQVIRIDLPGHRRSGSFAEVHTMKEMAEVVYTVVKELELENVSIAGHSMGGYVSLEFLRNFYTMTKAVALVNSTPQADTEEKKGNRDRSISLVKRNKKAYVKMAISNLLSPQNSDNFKKEVEALEAKALQTKTKGITAALEGMKIRTDNSTLLRDFDGSKYILAGKEDPVMDFRGIKELSETCNCYLVPVSGGHLSYIEDKEALQKFMHFID